MINIKELKVGEVIKLGNGKAIVTYIDEDEICIIHHWGETDTLKEKYFKYWDSTGEINETFKKALDEIKVK